MIHTFDQDFYGDIVKVIVTGFIRPEYNYTSKGTYTFIPLSARRAIDREKPDYIHQLTLVFMNSLEALIQDIEIDKTAALHSLQRPGYQAFGDDEFLLQNTSQ